MSCRNRVERWLVQMGTHEMEAGQPGWVQPAGSRWTAERGHQVLLLRPSPCLLAGLRSLLVLLTGRGVADLTVCPNGLHDRRPTRPQQLFFSWTITTWAVRDCSLSTTVGWGTRLGSGHQGPITSRRQRCRFDPSILEGRGVGDKGE